MKNSFEVRPIGVIKTPYISSAPYQPLRDSTEEDFCIVLNSEFVEGLYRLESFRYIYVIYFLDRINRKPSKIISQPWSNGERVGVFASRSPVRPNSIGLSVVEIKSIKDNTIYISSIDAFNDTPVIDIKPYIKDLDTMDDANYGWIDRSKEHFVLHIKGIPHNY